MSVARDLYVAKDRADKEAALERHRQVHQRTIKVSRAPGEAGGSHILASANSDGGTEGEALYGTPDEIFAKLRALSAAGVEYILLSIAGGSRDSLRHFAREIMPKFMGD